LAQSHALGETIRAGDCFGYKLEMLLSGEMRVQQNGKMVPIKLEASAAHEFSERILVVGTDGLPVKSARFYDKARAGITAAGETSARALRSDRRLCVAQRYKDQPLVYSPAGPMSREEVDVVAEHFETLSLTGLLPPKPVGLGDTWKAPDSVVQALCNFGGLTEQALVCKLVEVKDDMATVSVTGPVSGIDMGALSKLTIDAKFSFDLKAHRLIRLEWDQKDERDQGPVSPALSVHSAVTVRRSAIERPNWLSDVSLVSVPEGFDPPATLTQLEYHDPKNRFDLSHTRDWQTVSQTEDHLVLRLIDRGDFVAQVTITPWTPAEKGSHLSPEEFREAMEATPGWEVDQVLQTGEVPAEGGKYIYRISALGQLDGMKVMQNFYLVASATGQQVVLAFTLTPKQADRLGDRDLSMAANLDFPTERKSK
jgi:hypothetical protein